MIPYDITAWVKPFSALSSAGPVTAQTVPGPASSTVLKLSPEIILIWFIFSP